MLIISIFWVLMFAIIGLLDWKTHRIPNVIVLPCILIAIALELMDRFVWNDIYTRCSSGIYIGLAYAFFIMIPSLLDKAGWGDVKYAFLIGFVLGWPSILFAVLVSGVSLLVVAWIQISRNRTFKGVLPYGLPLSIGAIVTILLPESILRMVS